MKKKKTTSQYSLAPQKLGRDEFFGHPDILKLSMKINKKAMKQFSYIYITDKKLIKLLNLNLDWLDVVGLVLEMKNKRTACLKWTRFE